MKKTITAFVVLVSLTACGSDTIEQSITPTQPTSTRVPSDTSTRTAPASTSVTTPKTTTHKAPARTSAVAKIRTSTVVKTRTERVSRSTQRVEPTTKAPVRTSESAYSRASKTPTYSAPTAAKKQPQISNTQTNSGMWGKIAQCESGGNPRAVSPNGLYRGLYQISASTWAAYGGTSYAARPDLASPSQQLAVAQKIQLGQGWNAWPTCSRR